MTCRYRKGVCSTCGGRIYNNINRNNQIDRGNLPAHDTLISGIRYWREESVDAAIEHLLANPEGRKPNLPPARKPQGGVS